MVNKVFKGNLQWNYNEWLLAGDHPLTLTGEIKKLAVSHLNEWLKTAWCVILSKSVIKGLKKCYIVTLEYSLGQTNSRSVFKWRRELLDTSWTTINTVISISVSYVNTYCNLYVLSWLLNFSVTWYLFILIRFDDYSSKF